MKRVMVIGSGGAGKSTFSRRLGEVLGMEVVHLDVHHWRPGWVETPKEEWARRMRELVSGEEENARGKRIYRLRSRAEVEGFLRAAGGGLRGSEAGR